MIKNMIVLMALVLSAPISAETTTDAPAAPTSDAPAAPATAGEIASGVCAGCHAADGNSVIPMNPILAGQHAEYIIKQLTDFKATESAPPKRNSPVMSSMVAALSPEDMKKLGEYYAKQKHTPSQVPANDEKLLTTGKILYHGGNIEHGVPACASCHGPTGSGIPPRYPALAGQHAEYTLTQLSLFNTGDRANDNDVMHKVLIRMSGAEKRAVATYISTMR
ncbi:cytochrome c553 [Nitrosomonas sp. Nm84]|uniref:c-type cytochrome n=1 Tax=Nitrosomonas sp. Nm84 TaxID=200124 RepID=UPI000DA09977|nr:cytochrome c4 [Nitrosomonas sp. Nm84]PXW91313.1 cytochrome c553 [Nitrosomonas sp. Nm84]